MIEITRDDVINMAPLQLNYAVGLILDIPMQFVKFGNRSDQLYDTIITPECSENGKVKVWAPTDDAELAMLLISQYQYSIIYDIPGYRVITPEGYSWSSPIPNIGMVQLFVLTNLHRAQLAQVKKVDGCTTI